MMTKDKHEHTLDELVEEAYHSIQPEDSWGALRERVHQRVTLGSQRNHVGLAGQLRFWRSLTYGLAACLVIGAVWFFTATENPSQPEAAASQNLISQAQLHQLVTAFSQVRELFDQHSLWMLVDSKGSGDIGVNGLHGDPDTLVVVRLVLSSADEPLVNRSVDVIGFVNQDIRFSLSVPDHSDIACILTLTASKDGQVILGLKTEMAGLTRGSGRFEVSDGSFTPLGRVPSGPGWIQIHAAAQSVPVI